LGAAGWWVLGHFGVFWALLEPEEEIWELFELGGESLVLGGLGDIGHFLVFPPLLSTGCSKP